MQNIKLTEECLDYPVWNDKSFCTCKLYLLARMEKERLFSVLN